MGKTSIINNNKAVAGVIEALLIVALVSIIISTIQLIYVPEIMKQKEADHMENIENQFSFLKAVIDIQSMEKKDVPITSTITLGSKELPYFVTARGFGELFIIGMDENNYKINIQSDEPYHYNGGGFGYGSGIGDGSGAHQRENDKAEHG